MSIQIDEEFHAELESQYQRYLQDGLLEEIEDYERDLELSEEQELYIQDYNERYRDWARDN